MLAKKPKGATHKRRSSGVAGLLWMFVGAILTLMIGLFLYLWNPFDMGSQPTTEQSDTIKPISQPETEGDGYEFYELLPEQEITSIPDEAIVQELPEPVVLNPDVVINVIEPVASNENDNQQGSSQDSDTLEYGISEETVQNPMQSQSPQAVEGTQEIAIIEEEGTYDEPSPSSSTNQNSTNNQAAMGNSRPLTTANSTASIKPATAAATYILQINSFSSAEAADKRRAQVLMAGVDARVVKNKQSNNQILYQVVSPPMTNRQAVIAAQQKLQNNGIDSLIVEQRR